MHQVNIKEDIMGRAKEEMMRQEELQPMYDWIEENYGDDAGEENSEEWQKAVQAYNDYCECLQQQDDEWYQRDALEWYIYNQSPIGIFNTQMQSISELLNIKSNNETQFSLFVMLHGHTVASVESYLASTFIGKVISSDKLIRKLIETDPVFSKTQLTLKEIYEKQEGLKFTVAKYLNDLIFHDLRKVKPMFKDVLDCEFGNISWLFNAVKIRHHCVHRAGLDKDGNKIDISIESIRELVAQSIKLIHAIDDKISNNQDDDIFEF